MSDTTLLQEAIDKGYYPKTLQKRYKQVHDAILEGENSQLQEWIDNGQAWKLEGHVGRTASSALEAGACVLPEVPIKDYWGNTVPAHWMLEEGTKGTVALAEEYEGELE